MKNLWLYKLRGIVFVHVQGENGIAFLNAAVRRKIKVWSIKKVNQQTIGFFISISDIEKLRSFRHNYRVKISFHKRGGFPFWFLRVKRNWAFFLGFLFFFFVVTWLSNMVWDIKITGASKEVEYRIMKQLNEMGLKRGAIQFTLNTPQEIQREIINQNGDITWIGVERKGTVYHLQVVEKTIPKVTAPPKKRHLVAKKAGVVSYILADKGQSKVAVNQYVKKGQVLISGYIGKEEQPTLVAATGKVLAETWYETTVVIPIENHVDTLTGNSKTKYGFTVFGKSLYFPWIEKPEHEETYIEKKQYPIYFLKWALPVEWNKKIYYERESVATHYTKKEIQNLGEKLAREKMQNEVGKDASVYGIKVLRQQETNGKVEITYHFQMIENIGAYEPIHNKENLLDDRKTKNG